MIVYYAKIFSIYKFNKTLLEKKRLNNCFFYK